jgi:hypothetical protein
VAAARAPLIIGLVVVRAVSVTVLKSFRHGEQLPCGGRIYSLSSPYTYPFHGCAHNGSLASSFSAVFRRADGDSPVCAMTPCSGDVPCIAHQPL